MTLLSALLALVAQTAHADSFFRVIERPVARYLLAETTQGQELLFRVLGHARAANHDARALRRFADAMENEARFAGLSGEIQERLARAGDSLRAARAEEGALGRNGDAVAYLTRYARAELRLARPASAGEVAEIRFVQAAEDTYSALRTEFLDDIEVGAGSYASFLLRERIEILSEGILSLEFTRRADPAAIWAIVEEMRGLTLQTAIQLEGARSAYAGHRSTLLSLAPRLERQVQRLRTPGRDTTVRSMDTARYRRELLDEITEMRGWLAPPATR